jgi:hypothetical protein
MDSLRPPNDRQTDMNLPMPRSQPEHGSPLWRRVIVFLVGGSLVAIGLAMLILPGPAIIFIPLGLAILATEFRWARKWLSTARPWLRGRFQKIRLKGRPES